MRDRNDPIFKENEMSNTCIFNRSVGNYSDAINKLKQSKMKNLKFRIHSPQHSEAIQKRLFELGYLFGGIPQTEITSASTDSPFFTCYENGNMSRAYLNEEDYISHSCKESTLDELYREEEKTSIEMKIGGGFTAIVHKGHSTFVIHQEPDKGGYVLDISKLKELHEAIEKLNG